VAFRPRLTTGLALSGMELTVPKQEIKIYLSGAITEFPPKDINKFFELIQVDPNLFNVPIM
jgi:hypothetical protein